MNITERQAEILKRTIKDYIDLASPVSSEFLEKKHNFGLSPATIRIEMQKLTEGGYLRQPHTSAGRVPTDKGYRYFVDSLSEEEIFDFDSFFKTEEGLNEDFLALTSRLTKFLARESSELALFYLAEKDFFWKEGWEEILKKPEFEEKKFVLNFSKVLQELEKNINNLQTDSGVRVYIGKEGPFSGTKDFSIIFSRCQLPEAKEGIISLLGPTRMTYNKNINLVRSLVRVLEDF